jgi:hypothetical protein
MSVVVLSSIMRSVVRVNVVVVSAVAPNRYLQGLTLQSLQVGDVTT